MKTIIDTLNFPCEIKDKLKMKISKNILNIENVVIAIIDKTSFKLVQKKKREKS